MTTRPEDWKLLLIFESLEVFQKTASTLGKDHPVYNHLSVFGLESETGQPLYSVHMLPVLRKWSKRFAGSKRIPLPLGWGRAAELIYRQHDDGTLELLKHSKRFAPEDSLAKEFFKRLEGGHFEYFDGPLTRVVKLSAPKQEGKSRGNAGENHYTQHFKNIEKERNEAFARKANGLHRLEVAITKWLGDSVSPVKLRMALDEARTAQADVDFQSLWDILDKKAAQNVDQP